MEVCTYCEGQQLEHICPECGGTGTEESIWDLNTTHTATIERLEEQLKIAMEMLQKSKKSHYYCEDSWYSCPLAEGGCCDDSRPNECNCDADKFNASIDEALNRITALDKGER